MGRRNNDLLMETPLPGVKLFRRRQKIKKAKVFFKRQARDISVGFKIIGTTTGRIGVKVGKSGIRASKRAIVARVKAERELRMGLIEIEKTNGKSIKRRKVRKESPLGFRF